MEIFSNGNPSKSAATTAISSSLQPWKQPACVYFPETYELPVGQVSNKENQVSLRLTDELNAYVLSGCLQLDVPCLVPRCLMEIGLHPEIHLCAAFVSMPERLCINAKKEIFAAPPAFPPPPFFFFNRKVEIHRLYSLIYKLLVDKHVPAEQGSCLFLWWVLWSHFSLT